MHQFPQIMGVINVTPDSFSDGGLCAEFQAAIEHALQLVEEGADILDIGGESTRPGAEPVPVEEELRRVVPVVEGIRRHHREIPISIDTTKYEVAAGALAAGATMLNDISALRFDPRIGELAAEHDVPLVLMHMQGTPRTMQDNPRYSDVVAEVKAFLQERIAYARGLGVRHIIADVGIGFGKTVEHNWELLRRHREFLALGVPMLLGISRKSFLGKTLGIEDPRRRDCATALLHALLLDSGISIVRVHNVALMAQLRRLWWHLQGRDSERG
ncbi:MAG: dihydropteroate synthase [Candidatus Kapabacteria bacterium]|nr:dihydropteroate synthase [Candidatus Kapabacteria bacterium]MDW7997066.1 dihydropteroate synthase [Bacteroidota bacterium]MDW8225661.1 dihydropteroate synthase [Bacteroidota bacterium]